MASNSACAYFHCVDHVISRTLHILDQDVLGSVVNCHSEFCWCGLGCHFLWDTCWRRCGWRGRQCRSSHYCASEQHCRAGGDHGATRLRLGVISADVVAQRKSQKTVKHDSATSCLSIQGLGRSIAENVDGCGRCDEDEAGGACTPPCAAVVRNINTCLQLVRYNDANLGKAMDVIVSGTIRLMMRRFCWCPSIGCFVYVMWSQSAQLSSPLPEWALWPWTRRPTRSLWVHWPTLDLVYLRFGTLS